VVASRRGRVDVTELAQRDLAFLGSETPIIAQLAARMLRELAAGTVTGDALQDLPFYGDLSGCFKLKFGVGQPPSHRIVYRELPDETLEVLEVVVIESRDDAYVYLLAAARLGQLAATSQPKLKRVHQTAIARRSARRRNKN
jgi:hypothetical protein